MASRALSQSRQQLAGGPRARGRDRQPGNTANRIVGKVQESFLAGVERGWVVRHDLGKLDVYDSPTSVRILTRDDTLTDEAMLPGFHLELSAFFGEPG